MAAGLNSPELGTVLKNEIFKEIMSQEVGSIRKSSCIYAAGGNGPAKDSAESKRHRRARIRTWDDLLYSLVGTPNRAELVRSVSYLDVFGLMNKVKIKYHPSDHTGVKEKLSAMVQDLKFTVGEPTILAVSRMNDIEREHEDHGVTLDQEQYRDNIFRAMMEGGEDLKIMANTYHGVHEQNGKLTGTQLREKMERFFTDNNISRIGKSDKDRKPRVRKVEDKKTTKAGDRSTKQQKEDKKILCKFHFGSGGCNQREKCKWSHILPKELLKQALSGGACLLYTSPSPRD